ncbi:MAG: NAD-dependent epimerase/dehydratase family protein [Myxococcota bacterium]
MRVLVTGGTGFVGSHAVEALCRAGHEVRLLARSLERVKRVFEDRAVDVSDVAVGDMADAEAVARALAGCDAALHAAATMYGGEAVLATNLAGVRNVVGAAERMGLDPVVYISTIAVTFPPPGPVIRVGDPLASLETTYGRSKVEGERFVRELQARGAPISIVYPSGVYGPDDPVYGETLKGLRARLRWGWFMTTGGMVCVDVRDLAGIITAALEPGKGPRRFMAGGHFRTWAEEADLCEALTGCRVRRYRVPGPALRGIGRTLDLLKKLVAFEYPLTHEAAQFVTRSVPCDSRATVEELGVEFRPLEETLADSIRWLYRSGHVDARYVGRLGE